MSVSAGSYHSIALKTDGTLWAWGAADNGPDLLTPTQIGTANDWVKIETDESNCLALKTNGTLWYLVGNDVNNFNQVGSSNNWQDFSINVNSNWGIKADGTLWRFSPSSGSSVQEGTDNNWLSVSAGQQYVILKKSNNTIWGKGTNTYGQIGTGNNMDVNTLPIQIGTNSDWNKISAGRFHSLLLNNSNSLYSMGYNGSGALGDGTLIDKNTPILFNCSTLSMTEYNNDTVSIYPNPCKDFLNIELNNELEINNITISDISGKIILMVNDVCEKIDVSSLKTGVYVLKINSNEKIIYKKIVKN
jgi:alpha-tubulin suppressor-like RCC1 family protein